MKRTVETTVLLAGLLAVATGAAAAPVISVNSGSAQPGGSHTLTLSLANGVAPYGGMNSSLVLPACMNGASVAKGALVASNDFHLDSYLGTHTVSALVYSTDQQFTGSGSLLSVNLSVGSDCEYGRYEIRFATQGQGLSNTDGSASITHTVNGSVLVVSTVNPANDADHDGMDDSWEVEKFGNISRDGSADKDGDGYTDFIEYINFSQGIMDSLGNPYDPNLINAPGGPGYDPGSIKKKNIWILFMPAILSNAKAK